MSQQMYHVALASRPSGAPVLENFRYESQPMPVPQAGEILVKILYLSLDPYMRGRMDDAASYANPVEIGQTMEGGAVGEVIVSNSERFQPGDIVNGMFGWASHGVLPDKMVRKLDPALAPVSTALGVLGMPGLTGWYGFTQIGQPKPGETLVVSAATGAVGSLVGQLGKINGLRVIGVAGGADKCAYAVDELGFDECLDHRAAADARELRALLKGACPDGVDIYFENVGGKTLEAVIPLMNIAGRIPVCGMISWYNLGGLGAGGMEGQDRLPKVWRTILVNRLHVQGFIISDHFDKFGTFLKEVGGYLADNKIKYRETVTDGLENAPQAFLQLLTGKNFGKQVVKVAEAG